MSAPSFERQLHTWLIVSLVVLMMVIWIAGNYAIQHLTENFALSRLEHDGESIVSALDLTPESEYRLRWRRLGQVYNQPYSGHYFVIRFNNGSHPVYSRSLWDHTLDTPALAVGERGRLRIDGPSEQDLLVWVRGFRKQGVDFTLAVAEDVAAIRGQREQFKLYFAALAMIGLLALLTVQSTVVRRAVRKLDPVRDDIKRLSNGETGQLSEDVPKEVLPLVQEVNHLLQLLSRQVERSRHSLGNLAHALKGPLSLLVQYFDERKAVFSRRDDQAREQVERLQELMERELKRARLVGKGVTGQRFDPRKELPGLIGQLRQIYSMRNISFEYEIEGEISPFGNREDMMELIGNLIDNAGKWAKSMVICRVSDNGVIKFVIEDDGEGLSDVDLDNIVRRGVRLDETTEGHGLGLSIVKDIVELYDGEMKFHRSEQLNGLKVVVELPH